MLFRMNIDIPALRHSNVEISSDARSSDIKSSQQSYLIWNFAIQVVLVKKTKQQQQQKTVTLVLINLKNQISPGGFHSRKHKNI